MIARAAASRRSLPPELELGLGATVASAVDSGAGVPGAGASVSTAGVSIGTGASVAAAAN